MQERKLGQNREKAKHKVHIYVATPAYDGKVNCEYSQSLAESAFVCPLFGVGFTACVMKGGAFIDLSRNLFCHWFLNQEETKECTHLFFIDADLKFEARALVGLAKSGQPICAGAYRRREKNETYPVMRSERDGGNIWIENDEHGGEWVMSDRAPTGFMCISRQVLEEMAKDAPKVKIDGQGDVAWLFHTYINDKGQFIGEDFAFCDDYRKKYGKPVPIWPDLDFTHDGYAGNYKAYLMRLIAEADEKQGTVESAAVEIPTATSEAA